MPMRSNVSSLRKVYHSPSGAHIQDTQKPIISKDCNIIWLTSQFKYIEDSSGSGLFQKPPEAVPEPKMFLEGAAEP